MQSTAPRLMKLFAPWVSEEFAGSLLPAAGRYFGVTPAGKAKATWRVSGLNSALAPDSAALMLRANYTIPY